jgi:manganese/zinc/iron transport system permease protein
MTQPQIEIQLIAVVAAAACALPGVFLVLRRMAMMSDAISHTVLLGIVLGFFITQDLASPLLVFGAAITGLLTVSLVELINRTRLVREDTAIGLVFPALFSFAVILISRYAGDVHLDTDAVLLGELAFAPFNRFTPFGVDIGPVALYLMGAIFLLNLAFILLFYKELKLATFDAGLAAALGFAPGLIHYALMGMVSITAVGAFEAVGSILVVAMMVAPPITAYLLTDRLPGMIMLSVLAGALAGISGYWVAHFLDASIAGSIATMMGVLFGLVFLLAPQRGLLAIRQRRARQRWDFAQAMLAIHLLNHEGLPGEEQEGRLDHLHEHIRWQPSFAAQVVRRAQRGGLILLQDAHLKLTDHGRQFARQMLMETD